MPLPRPHYALKRPDFSGSEDFSSGFCGITLVLLTRGSRVKILEENFFSSVICGLNLDMM